MVKPSTVNYIRTQSQKGRSANQIQRELRAKGIGLRRKTILTYVRKFKHRPPKPHAEIYVPRKYRRPEKHIAVYGKVKGKSKRLEIAGSGRKLYTILIDAVHHPPKQRIERVSADKMRGLSARAKYLDYGEEWDERPTIKS
jgi:hypothetical protein